MHINSYAVQASRASLEHLAAGFTAYSEADIAACLAHPGVRTVMDEYGYTDL